VTKLLVALSRITGRFGFWFQTVVILYLAGPFRTLDKQSRGRLLYAVLVSGLEPRTQRLFIRLLRRDLDSSADANLWLGGMAQGLGRQRLAALIYGRTARQKHSATEVAVARTMAELCGSFASGSIYPMIGALVDRLSLAEHEDIVLVSAGSAYLELFGLWLEQARKYVSGRIVGIALDATSDTALRSSLDGFVIDLSPFFVFDDAGKIQERSRNALWILRVLILGEIVSRGHRVISIDLDAVVLADLETMLQDFPDVDIVGQEDFSLPMDVARRLGFVICCGFMVLRPTPACIAFLDRWAKRTMRILHDQEAINYMIEEAGITNLVRSGSYFTFQSDGLSWLCPDKSMVSRDVGHGTVVRHFQQRDETIPELRAQLGL